MKSIFCYISKMSFPILSLISFDLAIPQIYVLFERSLEYL